MSLLLQALQKAAKSREEGEVDLSADALSMADELSLEPTPVTHLALSRIRPRSPRPAQAATVVQAGSVPAFDPMDYAREHYMLTIVGVAILLALGYGAYIYIQIDKPFRAVRPRRRRQWQPHRLRPRHSTVPPAEREDQRIARGSARATQVGARAATAVAMAADSAIAARRHQHSVHSVSIRRANRQNAGQRSGDSEACTQCAKKSRQRPSGTAAGRCERFDRDGGRSRHRGRSPRRDIAVHATLRAIRRSVRR